MERPSRLFLYHEVPADMRGTVLHPLNSFKETDPELFTREASKYDDRPSVMTQHIPPLNCLWNDVLHFTLVHPEELRDALIQAGMKPLDMSFYEIDPNTFDPDLAVVYLNTHPRGTSHDKQDDFVPFDPERLHAHRGIPITTRNYYRYMIENGNRPRLFSGVPHVLYKGSVDIEGARIVPER